MPLDTTNDRDALSIAEAARRLGIGVKSAYRAAAAGELPTIRIGRRVLVPREALGKLLRQEVAE